MFILRWALKVGKTARELLESVTSEEITEMMAFERMEPWGSLPDQFAAGQICAVVANVNRGKDSEAYKPWDFFPALARSLGKGKPVNAGPILLDDPEEQSKLIKRVILGMK